MATETKFSLSDTTVSDLQELIQMNIDAHDGFDKTADKIDDMSVSSMFREFAQQRETQASELQELVALNAEDPQEKGSMAAAAHRTWIDLRTALGGGLTAVLEEAERGEDHIKAKYESVLKSNPGSGVSDVLHRHYAAVKTAHDRVRDMRDAHKNA